MKIQNSLHTAAHWRKALTSVGYCAGDEVAEQVAEWSKTMSPLVITGPEYGGKSLLVESIIELLNKQNNVSGYNTCHVQFTAQNSFEELFYEWNGRTRKIFTDIAKKGDFELTSYKAATSSEFADQGMLAHLLKSKKSFEPLIIDFFTGKFPDDRTDEYLARFIEHKEIFIKESGEVWSLPEDKTILIFVIRNSYREFGYSDKNATDSLLAEKTFHLTIPEPTIAHKTEILRELYPSLPAELIKDFSVFTSEFNKIPDLQKKVSLGEFLQTAESFSEFGKVKLTTNALVQHAECLVKNSYDYENFPAHAARIMERIESAELSA